MYCFLILIPFPFVLRTCFIFQAEFVLFYMVLYWPNFSLMFSIHLFLYAGVYCMTKNVWIKATYNATYYLPIRVVCN